MPARNLFCPQQNVRPMIAANRQMRQPLDEDEVFGWWRAALNGQAPKIHINEPEPGFYKTRLIKGGPFVPCRIWLEQPVDDAGELCSEPKLRCEIDGREANPFDRWSWLAGRPISEEEYAALLVGRFVPQETQTVVAVATVAVDWSTMKPPF